MAASAYPPPRTKPFVVGAFPAIIVARASGYPAETASIGIGAWPSPVISGANGYPRGTAVISSNAWPVQDIVNPGLIILTSESGITLTSESGGISLTP